MIINIGVNAGKIDDDHWLYNEEEGGNRVIAECSHFIDLIKYISKSKIIKSSASGLGSTKKRFENFLKLMEAYQFDYFLKVQKFF